MLARGGKVLGGLLHFVNKYALQSFTLVYAGVLSLLLFLGIVSLNPPLAAVLASSYVIIISLIRSGFPPPHVKKRWEIMIASLSLGALWLGYRYAPRIDCASPIPVEIIGGKIEVRRMGCYEVNTEKGEAKDDLERIGCPAGVRFDLIQADPSEEVTVKGEKPPKGEQPRQSCPGKVVGRYDVRVPLHTKPSRRSASVGV